MSLVLLLLITLTQVIDDHCTRFIVNCDDCMVFELLFVGWSRLVESKAHPLARSIRRDYVNDLVSIFQVVDHGAGILLVANLLTLNYFRLNLPNIKHFSESLIAGASLL